MPFLVWDWDCTCWDERWFKNLIKHFYISFSKHFASTFVCSVCTSSDRFLSPLLNYWPLSASVTNCTHMRQFIWYVRQFCDHEGSVVIFGFRQPVRPFLESRKNIFMYGKYLKGVILSVYLRQSHVHRATPSVYYAMHSAHALLRGFRRGKAMKIPVILVHFWGRNL